MSTTSFSSARTQPLAPRRRPEILAPAGTEEAFAAALASGADAVYLGLSEGFHARGRSTAFNLEMLPQLVRRAHAADAKLYLTLNTLVFESELTTLEELLRSVVASGVDALIIQDPATAFLARRLSPDIRLHASTQMTISSAEGAAFAGSLGIERVVLPRELSAQEIARFTGESSMECEVFVHGALCMSWSGQCLTSEAFSERSANRGQCSQACRMPYEAVVDGKRRELGDRRYLLSPQDLAAHEVLPELLEAGVHSLKIEGRYKGPAYVSAAVDSWRNWRDALLRGATGADRERLRRDVARTQLTFSRGGSLGFLHGEDHQALVVATTPKHRGIALGEVNEVRGRNVRVLVADGPSLKELVRPGMGVMFELLGRDAQERDPESAPGGPLFGVRFLDDRTAELSFGQPGPDLTRVRVGDAVRLTGDPEIAREGERRVSQLALGRIPIRLRVRGRAGEPLHVEARVGVGAREPSRPGSSRAREPTQEAGAGVGRRPLSARVEAKTPLAPARSGGLDEGLLGEKLCALGGTPFHVEELCLEELEPGLHLPVSELKRMRRELLATLEAELLRVPDQRPLEQPCLPELRRELSRASTEDLGPPELIPLCRTREQLEAVIASGVRAGSEVELDWMEMVGLALLLPTFGG